MRIKLDPKLVELRNLLRESYSWSKEELDHCDGLFLMLREECAEFLNEEGQVKEIDANVNKK